MTTPNDSPADQACNALLIVVRNDAWLGANAAVTRMSIQQLETLETWTTNGGQPTVAIVPIDETQPQETLDDSDYSSHIINLWVVTQLPQNSDAVIDNLKLCTRQAFNVVNNFDSDDRSVMVWDCDVDKTESPTKTLLHQSGLFAECIKLRVEVARNDP